MVSVKNFNRSARARPPPADTPDESSAVTTSQVTPSIHDFVVSLGIVSSSTEDSAQAAHDPAPCGVPRHRSDLPLAVQAGLGVLMCGRTAPKSSSLLTAEFSLVTVV